MQHDSETLERDDAPITAAKDADADRALFAESVTINRPAQELYEFWRHPENLVQFMENIVSIEPLGPDARAGPSRLQPATRSAGSR